MTPPTSSRDSWRGSRGFVLYELLLALAILGLVAGIVFPRVVRPPGPAELRSTAQSIAALLRTDRNAALRRKQDVVSRVDIRDHRVLSGSGPQVVDVPRDVKLGMVQSSREMRADGGGFRFGPDGGSSGGVLSLRRGSAAYEVSVNWLTGAVLVGGGRSAPGAAE